MNHAVQFEILTGDATAFNGWEHTGDVRWSKDAAQLLNRVADKYDGQAIAAVQLNCHAVSAIQHPTLTTFLADPWQVN